MNTVTSNKCFENQTALKCAQDYIGSCVSKMWAFKRIVVSFFAHHVASVINAVHALVTAACRFLTTFFLPF